MFAGHFAVGFMGKRAAPGMSLGTLFLGAQWADLLWATLLLAGIEDVRINPGATASTPLAFVHYPWSHSLAAMLAWSLAAGFAYAALRRDRRGAIVLALVVASHWLLDALVHVPDLLLWPGGTTAAGLGLWNHRVAGFALEMLLLASGAMLYLRATRPLDAAGRWGLAGLVAALALLQAGTLSGTPPPGKAAVAWVGEAQWLFVAWAYWVDRHRATRTASPG